MSKSRGNVVNPDEVVREYGADSLRLYEMFMGPLEAAKPWSMEGVNGVRGFLDRVWRMIVDERAESCELNAGRAGRARRRAEQNRVLHKTIQGVTQDLERMSLQHGDRQDDGVHQLLHEVRRAAARGDGEAWCCCCRRWPRTSPRSCGSCLGHDKTLAYEPWPAFDPAAVHEDTVEVPVQINGKLRGRVMVPAGARKPRSKQAARSRPTHRRAAWPARRWSR